MIACTDLGIGGVQNVIMGIVRSLRSDYVFDVVVFNRTDSEYEKEILKYGMIYDIPCRKSQNPFLQKLEFYIRPMRIYSLAKSIMKKNGPYDVVHCNNGVEEALILLAAKQAGIKKRIAHAHTALLVSRTKVIRRLYDWVYRKMIVQFSTIKIACSTRAGENLFGKKSDFKIIANPIDIARFVQPSSKGKMHWGIIHVGNFDANKNQLFVVNVFKEIISQAPEARLTLIGGGNNMYRDAVVDKVKKLELEKFVSFLPPDTNIPDELARNSIFLFPSKTEGLGIALMEAQVAGLRCFASDSVPIEADLGNVRFFDLRLGAKVWAEEIYADITNNNIKKHIKYERVSQKIIAEQYRDVYSS